MFGFLDIGNLVLHIYVCIYIYICIYTVVVFFFMNIPRKNH